MQAKTEFEATRRRIIYALKVYSEGLELRKTRVEAMRQEWVEAPPLT